jgi:ABC-2 type transport system ATP-binding protein
VISLDSTDADATVRRLVQSGTSFTDLEVTSAGLEDAFLALTSEEHA